MEGSREDGIIKKLIAELDDELSNYPESPFSESAFLLLRRKINEFIIQLVNESFKIAKRHRSDIISEAYVEQASDYLVSNIKTKYSRICGTLGGVFLGFLFSIIYSMVSNNQYNILTVGLSLIFTVLSAIFLFFSVSLK